MSGIRAHVVVTDRGVDVAFEVGPGECLALVGPNGAGKSTIVGALAGLLPTSGSIAFDDRVVAGHGRPVPAHRRRVGLVGQRPDLFPHLSVRGNVAYGARASGASGREARGRAEIALAAAGVAALSDRAPATLSGGQAQRVAIARALATEPAVLLLDEPTSALDVGARDEVRAALRLAAEGRPTVLVTHDPVEVVSLAHRVVVLEAGRVVEHGSTAEVLRRPRSTFGAAFSGLVLVRGTATADGIAPTAGGALAVGTHAVPPGRPALAVYHPTAARVRRDGAGLERRVRAIETRDGLVRVVTEDLVADVTVAAAATLGLVPGEAVRIAVPSDEVEVYAP